MNDYKVIIDNIETILSVATVVLGVGVPAAIHKSLKIWKLLKDIIDVVEKDEKPNKELYEQYVRNGQVELAKYINSKLDKTTNFSA